MSKTSRSGDQSSAVDFSNPLQLASAVELREVNRIFGAALARRDIHDSRSRVEIHRAAEVAHQVDILIGIHRVIDPHR